MAPAIFNERERHEIRVKMLEEGFHSIKKNGYRNTTVVNIANAAGIAKGTFYNFFSSKEQFVTAIIEHRNEFLLNKIKSYCKAKSFESRKDLFQLAKYILSAENDNLYNYLSLEDIIQISKKAPNFRAPDKTVEDVVLSLLELIPDRKKTCDWKSLVNYSRVISIMRNPDNVVGFFAETRSKNIDSIIELMVDEVWPE